MLFSGWGLIYEPGGHCSIFGRGTCALRAHNLYSQAYIYLAITLKMEYFLSQKWLVFPFHFFTCILNKNICFKKKSLLGMDTKEHLVPASEVDRFPRPETELL